MAELQLPEIFAKDYDQGEEMFSEEGIKCILVQDDNLKDCFLWVISKTAELSDEVFMKCLRTMTDFVHPFSLLLKGFSPPSKDSVVLTEAFPMSITSKKVISILTKTKEIDVLKCILMVSSCLELFPPFSNHLFASDIFYNYDQCDFRISTIPSIFRPFFPKQLADERKLSQILETTITTFSNILGCFKKQEWIVTVFKDMFQTWKMEVKDSSTCFTELYHLFCQTMAKSMHDINEDETLKMIHVIDSYSVAFKDICKIENPIPMTKTLYWIKKVDNIHDKERFEEYQKILIPINPLRSNESREYKRLIDRNIFKEDDWQIENIIPKNDSELKVENPVEIDIRKSNKKDFIFSDGAKDRIERIGNYIFFDVPVLLEGPTGTAKTISVEMACELLDYDLVRFNLSSETRISDLFGKPIGNPESWGGISFKNGVFIESFQRKCCLLLDEINLAPQSVLQSIEEAIESGYVCVNIPGRPFEEIKKHPGFRIVATQNPNKGAFANKRQDLGEKFLSRFQVINFPSFSIQELNYITNKIASDNGFAQSKIINDLVRFHYDWSINPIIRNDIICFTIRDIISTIKCILNQESVYNSVNIIYGSKYSHEKRIEFDNTINKFPSLKTGKSDPKVIIPGNQYFPSKVFVETIDYALFALRNNKHILITGSSGSGKTKLAMTISDYWNNLYSSSKNENKYYCVCTEEIRCSDLLGRQIPTKGANIGDEILKWNNGFLTNAVIDGSCAILDNIEEAPATVYERLNSLLDSRDITDDGLFQIPENTANPFVSISPSFRLICICQNDSLDSMTPSFLNRFVIINLNDQLSEMNENQKKGFIQYLLKSTENSQVKSGDIATHNHACLPTTNGSDILIDVIFKEFPMNMTVMYLSKLCKGSIILFKTLIMSMNPIGEEVVRIINQMLTQDSKVYISEAIQKCLIDSMDKSELKDFYFEGSQSLKHYICIISIASMIGLPLIISGPTGVGKTQSIVAFSMIRQNCKRGYQMHSFHSSTRPSHFYGSVTFKDNQIMFNKGPLSSAFENGQVFIADEFNLSTQSLMKIVLPVLESSCDYIYVPGVGEYLTKNQSFHFIACQNDLLTLGRNSTPISLLKKCRIINYPEQTLDDLQSIARSIYYEELQFNKVKIDDALNTAHFISIYNQKYPTEQWSIRDFRKVLKRLQNYHQQSNLYVNILIYHILAFHALIKYPKDKIKERFDEIISILSQVFLLNPEQIHEIIDMIFQPALVTRLPKREGLYLTKGKCSISSSLYERNHKLNEIDENLTSVWDSIFYTYLLDDKEPILFVGAPGYKTFLSKRLAPSSQIIYLNQEISINQLIGTSVFLSPQEVKLFYIKLFCQICECPEKIHELSQQTQIDKKVLNIKPPHDSESIQLVLEKIRSKLLSLDQISDSILSGTVIELNPGLILTAILSGKSLIMDNLSSLPTVVLERFNELFSSTQALTLNEDIHDTFTTPQNREIKDFSNNFRIISTSSSKVLYSFSEAILSRLTVIHVEEYTNEEQEFIFNKIHDHHNIELKFKDIQNILSTLGDKIHYNFTMMIELFNIFLRNPSAYPGYVVYRYLFGFLKSNNHQQLLLEVIRQIFRDFDENYISKYHKCPLIFKGNTIVSMISNIKMSDPLASEFSNPNITFYPGFCDMIDIIFYSFSSKTPLILDGPLGQGKLTAIQYVSNILQRDIHRIIITQSTKSDDIFGRIDISSNAGKMQVTLRKTHLCKIIDKNSEYDNKLKNSIIIFENLHCASQAVLEALYPIFDHSIKSFSLSDGSVAEKSSFYDVIGIFNSEATFKEKLPSSILYSSLFYNVPNPSDDDIMNIVTDQFTKRNIVQDITRFNSIFTQIKPIVNRGSNSKLSISDVWKYIHFRISTMSSFSEPILIFQFVFSYKFSDPKDIIQVQNIIGKGSSTSFRAIFSYSPNNDYFCVSFSRENNQVLNIPTTFSAEDKISTQHLNSLTLPQKHAFVFLACSVLSRQTPVLFGDTASGKSRIIRLFAETLGKAILVFQMNNETNSSIFSGQNSLSDRLSQYTIDSIKQILFEISNCYPSITICFDINCHELWKPSVFSKLCKSIDEYIKNEKSSGVFRIVELKQGLVRILSPINRFEFIKSQLLKAMTEGHWVLFDGIESSPYSIPEKLSRLCGEYPEIDFINAEKSTKFSRNGVPPFKIHDDFRVFITICTNSKVVMPGTLTNLIEKCVSFTLPSIDSTPVYSSEVSLGLLSSLDIKRDWILQLSARLAQLHQFARNLSIERSELFCGGIRFTSRNFIFSLRSIIKLTEQFSNSEDMFKHFPRILFTTIKSYYLDSCINDKSSIQKDLINCLLESPKQEILNDISAGFEDADTRNFSVFKIIYQVQKCILNKQSIPVVGSELIKTIFHTTQVNDVKIILYHIDDTLLMSENNVFLDFLLIIRNVLSAIYDCRSDFSQLDNLVFLNNPQLYHYQSILRLLLLNKLLDNGLISLNSNIEIIKHPDLVSLLACSFENDSDFIKLLKLLSNNDSKRDILIKFFPYKNHGKKSLWIPVIADLANFNVKICFKFGNYEETINQDGRNQHIKEVCFVFSTPFVLCKESYVFQDYKLSFDDQDTFLKRIKICLNSKNVHLNKTLLTKLDSYPSDPIPIQNNLLSTDFSIISQLWYLCYMKIIDDSSVFMSIFELDFYQIIHKSLCDLSIKGIDSMINWSKLILEFEKNSIFLKRIRNCTFDGDIASFTKDKLSSEMKQIESELSFLEMNIQLPSKELNNVYQNLLIIRISKYKKAIEDMILNEEKKKTIMELDRIKREIQEMKTQNPSLIIKDIIATIDQLDIVPESIKSAQKIYNYLRNAKDNQLSEIQIRWPFLSITNNFNYSKDELIYHLIWYSQTYKYIDNIHKSINVFQNISQFAQLSELNTFPEIIAIKKVLLSDTALQNSGQELAVQPKTISDSISILNSVFLFKLISIKMTDYVIDPQRFIDYLNSFANRNNLLSQKYYQWIYEIAPSFNHEFSLVIPMIRPRDLLFLFLKFDGKQWDWGNFINRSTPVGLLRMMESLMNKDYQTYIQCTEDILSCFRNHLLRNHIQLPNDFTPECRFTDNLKEYNSFISCLRICYEISFQKPKIRSFISDDLLFLSNDDFYKEEEFVNKYPSLQYWLLKNPDSLSSLKETMVLPSNNSYPIAIHFLRVFSNTKCISIQNTLSNHNNEVIDTIDKNLIFQIENHLGKEQVINKQWINLCVENVPSSIYHKHIEYLRLFLLSFANNSTLGKISWEIKDAILKPNIEVLIISVFNQTFERFLNRDLKSKDFDQSMFIADPYFCVSQFRKNTEFQIINGIRGKISDLMKKLSFVKSIIDFVSGNKLEEAIELDINEKEITENNEIRKKREKETIFNNSRIDKINQRIENVIKKGDKSDIEQFLNEYKIFQNHPKEEEVIFFICNDDSKERKQHHKKVYKIVKKTEVNEHPNHLPVFRIKKEIENTTIEQKKYHVYFCRTIEYNDLKANIIKESQGLFDLVSSLDPSQEFYYMKSKLSDLMNSVNRLCDLLCKLMNPKFNDESRPIRTEKCVSHQFNHFNKNLEITKKDIKEIELTYVRWFERKPTESNEDLRVFQIIFPENKGYYNRIADFSVLSYKNILSSVSFITLTPGNRLQFSLDRLELSIPPFIPSIHSGLIRIIIPSYSHIKIMSSIKCSNKEFSVFCNSQIIDNQSFEITLNTPNNLADNYVDHNVSGTVELSLEDLSSTLSIPFCFYFRILPQIVLFSCEGIKLLREGNGFKSDNSCLYSKTRIKFDFRSKFNGIKYPFYTEMEALENNTCSKPNIDTQENGFSLVIPDVFSKMQKLHFYLRITLVPNMQFNVLFDNNIEPSRFEATVFSPHYHEFRKDICFPIPESNECIMFFQISCNNEKQSPPIIVTSNLGNLISDDVPIGKEFRFTNKVIFKVRFTFESYRNDPWFKFSSGNHVQTILIRMKKFSNIRDIISDKSIPVFCYLESAFYEVPRKDFIMNKHSLLTPFSVQLRAELFENLSTSKLIETLGLRNEKWFKKSSIIPVIYYEKHNIENWCPYYSEYPEFQNFESNDKVKPETTLEKIAQTNIGTHFGQFISLINSKKILSISKSLPKVIKELVEKVITTESPHKKLQFIIEISYIMKEKYEYVKSNGFCFTLSKKFKELYEDFYIPKSYNISSIVEIDSFASQKNIQQFEIFMNNIVDVNELKIIKVEPCVIQNKPIAKEISLMKNINISFPSVYNIVSLDMFYNELIQICNQFLLLLYSTEKTPESFNRFSNILSTLVGISKEMNVDTKSFLRPSEKSFISSLGSLLSKLSSNGISIDKSQLPKYLDLGNKRINEMVYLPDAIPTHHYESSWITSHRQPNPSNSFNISSFEKYDPPKLEFLNPDFQKSNHVLDTTKIEPLNPIGEINEIGISQNIEDENSQIDSSIQAKTIIRDSPTKIINITQDEYERIRKKLTDQEILSDAVNRMKSFDIESSFEILKNPIKQVPPDFYGLPDNNIFHINKVIPLSRFVSSVIIEQSTSIGVLPASVLPIIICDCSNSISIQMKGFIMIMVCGLAFSFEQLELSYTIMAVADGEFKYVLKAYDEPHSDLVLQRVFDCLMISRFKTRLADCLAFAINNTPSDLNRAVFMFSNGFDERLVIPNRWKESVFISPKNSFEFIFIKDSTSSSSEMKYIESIWTKFMDSCSDSKSRVIVTPLQSSFEKDNIYNFASNVAKILKPEEFVSISKNIPPVIRKNLEIPSNGYISKLNESLGQFSCKGAPIFTIKGQIENFKRESYEKINIERYKDVIGQGSECLVTDTNEYQKLISSNLNRKVSKLIDVILPPNKATQSMLSDVGNEIDITAVLMNMINPMPEPYIYLEKKAGLIRNYSISIIIDGSRSCLSSMSVCHSIRTIFNLISFVSMSEAPSIDIVLASEQAPIYLCSSFSSSRTFSEKNTIIPSLISVLSNPSDNSFLSPSIKSITDIHQIRSNDSSHVVFILSDGHINDPEESKKEIRSLIQNGASVFGIGLGVYPQLLSQIVPNMVYSKDPDSLIEGISSFFGEFTIKCENILSAMISKPPTHDELIKFYIEMDQISHEPTFCKLKEFLFKETPITIDAHSDYLNVSDPSSEIANEFIDQQHGGEFLKKNVLKGTKMLVVMLWVSDLNPGQQYQYIKPEYLFTSAEPSKSKECLKTAIQHFGMELEVVTSYEEFFVKINQNTPENMCQYNQIWVLCGPHYPKIPNGKNPHFIDQFTDCLLLFWKSGGSVVFWTESNLLYYQANKFLEKAVFPGNIKTNLRLIEEHQGMNLLKGDVSGQLIEKGLFNKKQAFFGQTQRENFGHSLNTIYEGETIAFAINDPKVLSPFIPFAIDSEGGVTSMFYSPDFDTRYGDIIIDCGYTKMFVEFDKQGTFRYIQNIAAFASQTEYHASLSIKPHLFRPNAVNFPFDPQSICIDMIDVYSSPYLQKFPTLFIIDISNESSRLSYYTETVQNILNKYKKEDTRFLVVNSVTKEVSFNELQNILNNRQFNEVFNIDSLIGEVRKINPKRYGHLVLVYSSRITYEQTQNADRVLENLTICSYCTSFSIGNADLSISAPFCRKIPSTRGHITDSNMIWGLSTIGYGFYLLSQLNSVLTLKMFKDRIAFIKDSMISLQIGRRENPGLMESIRFLENHSLDKENSEYISYLAQLKTIASNGASLDPNQYAQNPDTQKHQSKTDTKDHDVLFMIDSTGSMSGIIKQAQEKAVTMANIFRSNNPGSRLRFGAVCYRDPIDSSGDINQVFSLTSDINSLSSFFGQVTASGGGDGPEDWVGAFRCAIKGQQGTNDNSGHIISWSSCPNAIKQIVLMADAPPHGNLYGGSCSHQDQEKYLGPLLEEAAKNGFNLQVLNINNSINTAVEQIRIIYSRHKCSSFYSEHFDSNNSNNNVRPLSFSERVSNFLNCVPDSSSTTDQMIKFVTAFGKELHNR